jgi:hypothetical protein
VGKVFTSSSAAALRRSTARLQYFSTADEGRRGPRRSNLTQDGAFVAQFPVHQNNGGAFGLALMTLGTQKSPDPDYPPVDARTIRVGSMTTVRGGRRRLEPIALTRISAACWPMAVLLWSIVESGTRSRSE